jgi:NAD(P)-dependent dehydrogenase (short-subunit alcohol dehydrogenase family)
MFAYGVAPVIAFLRGDGRWINGADLPVDGGFATTHL